jgi:hypothetical protein
VTAVIEAADVIAATRSDASASLVWTTLDGNDVGLLLDVTRSEHRRRVDVGVGAVGSRRLLHALWELPGAVPWPVDATDSVDVATLEADGAGFVDIDHATITRLYEPVGTVRAVVVVRPRLADALRSASLMPRIFYRLAIATREAGVDEAVACARSLGVGAAVCTASELDLRVAPAAPMLGVPGIYRWWLAEVAYEEWRQTNAH